MTIHTDTRTILASADTLITERDAHGHAFRETIRSIDAAQADAQAEAALGRADAKAVARSVAKANAVLSLQERRMRLFGAGAAKRLATAAAKAHDTLATFAPGE
jgi:hypothetical protein